MATKAPIWEHRGEQKRLAVQQMFADIAPSYDRVNGIMSLSLHRRWREAAVQQLHLTPGATAIDLCSGTGDFAGPLRRAVGSTGRVIATDFCLPMLVQAEQKGESSLCATGDATRLPLASQICEGVTVGWGIRNVPDIDAAHREAFRILRPGGAFVSLDMAIPQNAVVRRISHFLFSTVVPTLGRLIGRAEAYRYLPESTERFMTREQLVDSMQRAGFTEIVWKDFMFGNICLHFGRKPAVSA